MQLLFNIVAILVLIVAFLSFLIKYYEYRRKVSVEYLDGSLLIVSHMLRRVIIAGYGFIYDGGGEMCMIIDDDVSLEPETQIMVDVIDPLQLYPDELPLYAVAWDATGKYYKHKLHYKWA